MCHVLAGKGMPYLPGAASLAATHKAKVKKPQSNYTTRDKRREKLWSCDLTFEEETLKYDRQHRETLGNLGKYELCV